MLVNVHIVLGVGCVALSMKKGQLPQTPLRKPVGNAAEEGFAVASCQRAERLPLPSSAANHRIRVVGFFDRRVSDTEEVLTFHSWRTLCFPSRHIALITT